MMAQPGHPVFLDTLNRIMTDLETHRVLQQRDSQKRTEGEEDESERQDRLLDVVSIHFQAEMVEVLIRCFAQLDFTGPGVL
jgi:hypothetical protein